MNDLQLIELIEALKAPDWWSVGITFFATVVAAVITYILGKRQNKIQEQQTKIQEYDTYRRIYKYLLQIESFTDTIFVKIAISLLYTNQKDKKIELIRDIQSEVNALGLSIEECSLDIELKICDKTLEIKNYYHFIIQTRNILSLILAYIEEGFIQNSNQPLESINNTTPRGTLINKILNTCHDIYHLESLNTSLLKYNALIETLKTESLKNTIKERLKATI
ncbi:MAG: hypothetical protein IKC17_04655 [Bacteroidales bacterium]|nr:hypothetical protein [Bacteroidales bacterium]